MVDSAPQPVVVSANQGPIDSLTAIGRLVLIILSTAPAAALVIKKHDLIALYDFFHTQQGAALLSALSGLIALLWGVYKSFKRGNQIASVAGADAVPDSVAQLK